jgi:hypothetical protein
MSQYNLERIFNPGRVAEYTLANILCNEKFSGKYG